VRGGALLPRAAAGDVLVGLDWLRRQPWAVADRMALFGVSFGAATIMDTLVLAAPDRMPTSLLEKPPAGLDGVRAAALLAPWCAGDVVGFNLIRAVHQDFARPVPVLAVLPDADTVSDVALCRDILERNRGRGVPVEMVRYQGAGHTFALAVDEYGDPFPDYDARLAADAFRRIHAFLEARLR
jgi:dienelactone hydrolase